MAMRVSQDEEIGCKADAFASKNINYKYFIWNNATGIYILAISPPGGGDCFSKLKNREEFEGELHEKKVGKRGERKKKRVIKHTLKYLYEA